jgi:hypothetical protein
VLRALAVLAATSLLPGCATLIASALGARGAALQAATDVDVAIARGIAEGLSSSGGASESEAEELDPASPPPSAAEWSCRLDDGEVQEVSAHTEAGARAACLASNDVDLVRESCDCTLLATGAMMAARESE